jgi:hypothetical protein
MLNIRTERQFISDADGNVVLTTKNQRRLTFFFWFIVFVLVFIFGFDAEVNWNQSSAPFLTLYAGLTALFLGLSIFRRDTVFPPGGWKPGYRVIHRIKVLWLTLSQREEEIPAGAEVQFQKVILTRSMGDSGVSRMIKGRTSIFRLFVKADSFSLLLADGNYPETMAEDGKELGRYLSVPFEVQEI